jgi:uncharacterized protein YidB (DUF937 family)
MSKSTPSLLALLGLVAVAGFQNRGRIGEMLSDAGQKSSAAGAGPAHEDGGVLSEIGQHLPTGLPGTGLSDGLDDLINRFNASGKGAATASWVSDEANMPIDVDELEAVLGNETVDALAQNTGLSRAELLLRLNAALPEFVNRLTPNGRLPTHQEAQVLL